MFFYIIKILRKSFWIKESNSIFNEIFLNKLSNNNNIFFTKVCLELYITLNLEFYRICNF